MAILVKNDSNAHALTDFPHIPGVITSEQRANLRTVGEWAPSWFTWAAGSKAPTNPRTGAAGKVDDPTTAGTFAEAIDNIPSGGGIGVLMTDATPEIVALDFDHVIEDGVFTALGAQVVEQFRTTYVEISPSGTGLRVFALGTVDTGRQRGGGVELYPAGALRWLRMTGAVLRGTGGGVVPCQSGNDWAVGAMLAGDPDNVADSGAGGGATVSRAGVGRLTIDQVLDRLEGYRGHEGKTVSEVREALQLSAKRKPSSELAAALNMMATGDEKSEHDYLVICEGFRRGLGTTEDACELLAMLAIRDKVGRKDYQKRTAESAARAVLAEVEKPGFNRNGFRAQVWGNLPDNESGKSASPAPLPDGMADVLAETGEVILRTAAGWAVGTPGNVKAILISDPRVKGLAAFNTLTQDVVRTGSWRVFDRHAADEPGRLADIDVSFLGAWLHRCWGINLRDDIVAKGVEMAARANIVNPVKDSLLRLGLEWDGTRRLGTWLTEFAMIDDTGCPEYVSEVGVCFMVALVGRALNPGCEFHTVLTIEGSYGGGKSNTFQILADAIAPDLFTDSLHDVSNPVHVVEATEGKVIVEIAELSAFNKSDAEALKKMISSRADRVRKAYAHRPVDVKRGFVIVATTNKDQYIADPTGAWARRIWPVRSKGTEENSLNRAALQAVASQLLGEAVRLYQSGTQSIRLVEGTLAFDQWRGQRAERQVDLAFDEEINLLMMRIERNDVTTYRVGPNGAGGITLKDVAKEIGIDPERYLDGKYTVRVADTLKAKGFIRQPKSHGLIRWKMPPGLFAEAGRMRIEAGKLT